MHDDCDRVASSENVEAVLTGTRNLCFIALTR